MSMLDAKKRFIIDVAAKQFSMRPIKDVTVKDIASAAGVGEATVYRYFGTKGDLIVACAEKIGDEVFEYFIATDPKSRGIDSIRHFYEIYLEVFVSRNYLYRFLSEFDAFVINEGVRDMEKYADTIDGFKAAFSDMYRKGIEDGSVRPMENVDVFYYATTHALLSLCKKLAAEKPVIRQDNLIEKKQEISMLIDLFTGALSNSD